MIRPLSHALAAALLAGLAGCSRSETPPSVRDGASPAPAAARDASRYRGLYTSSGPDSGTIALCGGAALPARDGTGGELRRAHDALGGGPEHPVFVEVRAESVVAGGGSAAHLEVVALVRASPVGEGAGCAEPPARYRFRASGNEPFWSATVGADSIVFEQPDEPRRTAIPLASREEGANERIFRGTTSGASPNGIRVTVKPGRCSDSMSGALYSFSAEVAFGGRSLSGCAREGDLPPAP
ncbi:MAG TPA: hypothetical protein VFP58_09020 [Candidatus Eisenbacteria bacterium]|nr:hypothetical protein [Candidatus Eisenbacteria bacterium]